MDQNETIVVGMLDDDNGSKLCTPTIRQRIDTPQLHVLDL